MYHSAMQHSVSGYNLKTYTFTVCSPLTLVGGYASLRKNNILHSLCLRIPTQLAVKILSFTYTFAYITFY